MQKPNCLTRIGGKHKNDFGNVAALTLRQAVKSRNVRCPKYRNCLNYAANRNWDSFVCQAEAKSKSMPNEPVKTQSHRRPYCVLNVRKRKNYNLIRIKNIPLAQIMNEHKISASTLAIAVGCTQPNISHILKNGNPPLKIASKIRDYIQERTGNPYLINDLFKKL